jgi:hypothetical protein
MFRAISGGGESGLKDMPADIIRVAKSVHILVKASTPAVEPFCPLVIMALPQCSNVSAG